METICLLLIDPPRHRCNLQLWLTCLLGVACLILLIGPLALLSLAGPLWGWSLQGRGGHAATVIHRKLAEQKFIQDIDRLLSRAVAFRSLHEKSEIKICLMLSVEPLAKGALRGGFFAAGGKGGGCGRPFLA